MAEQRTIISGYRIVTADSGHRLEERVAGYIARGWEPIGGVSFAFQGFGANWAQAMVTREPRHG